MFQSKYVCVCALFLLAVAGCAAESEAASSYDGPQPELDTVAPDVISVNATGTWESFADKPYFRANDLLLMGTGRFTGPAGSTRGMGTCLIELTSASCATVADCAGSPATLPTGGARYCEYGRCGFRGPKSQWCAGTPAGSGPVPPGSYSIYLPGPPKENTGYITRSCFEGCFGSPAEVSPITTLSSACMSCARSAYYSHTNAYSCPCY